MSVFATTAAAASVLAGLPLLWHPVNAPALETHLLCNVLPGASVGGGLLDPGLMPRFAVITNSTSAPIPAGTTYGYTIAGRHFTFPAGTTVAVQGNLLVAAPAGAPGGPCDATIPRAAAKAATGRSAAP